MNTCTNIVGHINGAKFNRTGYADIVCGKSVLSASVQILLNVCEE